MSGQDSTAYQRALRQAKAACAILPDSSGLLNTLGVAFYRVGEFENSLTTLAEADRLNRGTRNRAADLLVMAMCYGTLGRNQTATELLKEARTLMGDSQEGELGGFAREAGQLIEGNTR